jgi:hypothetical protein
MKRTACDTWHHGHRWHVARATAHHRFSALSSPLCSLLSPLCSCAPPLHRALRTAPTLPVACRHCRLRLQRCVNSCASTLRLSLVVCRRVQCAFHGSMHQCIAFGRAAGAGQSTGVVCGAMDDSFTIIPHFTTSAFSVQSSIAKCRWPSADSRLTIDD